MDSFILSVIAFLIVLGPLIIIHEWGHFIACRIVGVTVLEFGIGFPPRAVKLFERNGTIYSLNWLPIGGFVRPLGEDFVRPLSAEATEAEKAAYTIYQAELAEVAKKSKQPIKGVMDVGPWSRMLFLAAGSTMNFIAGFVILVVAALIGIPSPAPIVAGASITSPAGTSGFVFGDLVVAVNGTLVTDANAVTAALNESAGKPVTVTIERNGERRDLTIQPTDAVRPRQNPIVTGTAKDSPAAGVFEQGDIILAVNGTPVSTNETLQKLVEENAGKLTPITIVRKGEEKVVEVTPRETPPENQGRVGIFLSEKALEYNQNFGLAVLDSTNGGITRLGFGDAVNYGITRTGAILNQLITFPVELVRGLRTIQEARPVSIVGISQIGSQALQASIEERRPHWILNFAALISIALGFTNLLPIPGFDGGRILFVIIELLRRKPMNPEREGMIHFVGLMIILALFVLLIINDIVNPIGQIIR
ncbi:MAG TPA: RIP metalloprotease RseP [Aggregatilineales bacterium]|nr:RIP metalloprotease RseP [Anaerolineales bacterium]HRE48452.1 RIP metalloprotease RseP [Aggregatilineales bacterium]